LPDSRPSHGGAVACGHDVTAAAAREILMDGGNAFDAAIAAIFAACVAETALCSLAGGGYLLARERGAAPVVYDFFADTPVVRRLRSEIDMHPIDADFGTATQEFHVGLGAVATPGIVAGLFELHRDLGGLPIKRLVEPAIRAARGGVTINRFQAYLFQILAPIYLSTGGARSTYGESRDALPHAGQHFRQPDLATTLEWLCSEGPDLLYRGELGTRLIEECRNGGGQLTIEDLRRYRVRRAVPLTFDYRDARIFTNPPPSRGGILIGFALALLNEFSVGSREQSIGLLIEAMRLANRVREQDSESLLDPALVDRYRTELRLRPGFNRGTTHVSIIDREDNVVSVSLSNGEGCGHVLPGTGIMLNNMLGEEDINPGGLQRWHPGVRMASMMAPTLIERTGARTVLGSGGSNRIRSAILQVIINLVDHAMTAEQAVNAARIHVEGDLLSVEDDLTSAEIEALRRSGLTIDHWRERNMFFGGVHVVDEGRDGLHAVGDPRRSGVGITLP
jgi:gamma-glutamyltranspeptidase/glutathione hydrolase